LTPKDFRLFKQYGSIANIKIPPGKGCAFVEFMSHDDAVNALKMLGNTTVLGMHTLRLAWGKPSHSASPFVEKRKLDEGYEQPSLYVKPESPTDNVTDEESAKKRRV
jgi:RNA recognition motif-containing protein